MKRFFALVLVTCAGVAATPGTGRADVIQLGIIVDSSGSIGTTNFNSMRTGIANALSAWVPTNSTVELTVVRFASGATTIVSPTLINSPATLASVVATVQGMTFTGGSTAMDQGINLARTLVTGSPEFAGAQRQVFNIVTDGVPNDSAATVAARNAAIAAGIDELSAEFIGPVGSGGYNFLLNQLVFPTPGYQAPPFQSGRGFVYPVTSFGVEFENAFREKLQFITTGGAVPEPATLAVFGFGALVAGGLYRRNRKAAA